MDLTDEAFTEFRALWRQMYPDDSISEAELRRAVLRLLRIADKMVEAGLPEMTQEEVQSEIDAYSAEKRRARARRA